MQVRTRGPNKKRYWIVCQDCGARRRAAYPTAKYCPGGHCGRHAQRLRQKARQQEQLKLKQLEAARLAEAELQRQAEEHEYEQECLRVAEADSRQPAEEEARRRETEAKQQRDIQRRTKVQPCPQCGCENWTLERPGLLAQHATKRCVRCSHRMPSEVWPIAPCRCKWRLLHLDRFGTTSCVDCGRTMSFQENQWRKLLPA